MSEEATQEPVAEEISVFEELQKEAARDFYHMIGLSITSWWHVDTTADSGEGCTASAGLPSPMPAGNATTPLSFIG